MFGKVLRVGVLAGLVFVGALASGSLAAAARESATTCSTQGLAFSAGKTAQYKVVQLRSDGVPCSKARTIAQQVARDLLRNKPIALNGVEGLGMSTNSCSGCGTAATTQIALSYPTGKITVSLKGRGAAGASGTPLPSNPFPAMPFNPFPTIPGAPASGQRHLITV